MTTIIQPQTGVVLAVQALKGPHGPLNSTSPPGDGDSQKSRPAWAAWQRRVQNKRAWPRSAGVLPRQSSPLLWGLPSGQVVGGCTDGLWSTVGLVPAETLALVRTLDTLSHKGSPSKAGGPGRLHPWLIDTADLAPNLRLAIESLAWCRALPNLATRLSEDDWWCLWERLKGIANRAEAADCRRSFLSWQLLSGELRLTLAKLFPEFDRTRALGFDGLEILALGMRECLHAEGLPRAQHLGEFAALLACWTRVMALGRISAAPILPDAMAAQFRKLVGHAIRLSRPNGTLAATPLYQDRKSVKAANELLREAASLSGDPAAGRLLAMARSTAARPPNGIGAALPSPAVHAEEPQVAVLRPTWRQVSPRLVVAYDDQRMWIELASGGEVLWSGNCEPQVELGGQAVRPVGNWEQVCWVSDHDADYLELELKLGGQVRIERHVLLARKDLFLLVADAIHAPEPSTIGYRCGWPLTNGVRFEPAGETREGYLVGGRKRALVLPLALGEWRSEGRAGELLAASDSQGRSLVELRLEAAGATGLFAPLFLDLDPKRLGRKATWRRLTVAADRVIQPPHVAAGFRVQVGSDQWIFYRSLAPRASRTLLGHNLITDFLAARFSGARGVEPLLEIE